METAPKIELRNVKHTAWMSEETHCYQATLYVDGLRWGTVSNEGHGGPDRFDGINGYGWEDIRELDQRIKTTIPPYTFDDGTPLDRDLEMICAELVNEWLRDRDFNKAMKNKVLYTRNDAEGVWQINVKKSQPHWMLLDIMKAKHPDYTYLVDLPVTQAKAIYFGE